MLRPVSALVLLLALAPALPAGVIHVPGDVADLQLAIDTAPDGATIVVDGLAPPYEPIAITKPLTLVGTGNPRPIILPGGPGPFAIAPVTLSGGGGAVRIENFWLGGSVDGSFYSHCSASIVGGGFDALYVIDSLVEGAPWDFAFNQVHAGASAIDVLVSLVWIERCEIRGADAHNASSHSFTLSEDAGSGIIAMETVVLLDSTVSGGNGPVVFFDTGGSGGCPSFCNGKGGDGVKAKRLVHSNSTITAGVGTSWKDEVTVVGCCMGPAGTAKIVQSEKVLPNLLSAPAAPILGQSYTLAWSTPGPSMLLFVSAAAGPDPQLGSPGLFLAPPLVLLGVLPSPSSAILTIPGTLPIGLPFTFQAYSAQGWSRPVGGILGP